MSDPMNKNSKPGLQELLTHSKIITSTRGYLKPQLQNLQTILNAVDSNKFEASFPVAIVAVIGPKGSGKSFLTNFLIEYLNADGAGGWMSSIVLKNKKEQPMGGFSYGSISSPAFFKPSTTTPDGSTSGIYLWPQPFLVKKEDSKEVLVWIMHIHSMNENAEDITALERFLMCVCSRIVEIKLENEKEFRILEYGLQLSKCGSTLKGPICDSIVCMIRSEKKILRGTDSEAKKDILDCTRATGMEKQMYAEILDGFKHVNVTGMKESFEKLHDQKGLLSQHAVKTTSKDIKNVVQLILDEAEISPKKHGKNGHLTLGNMLEFLECTTRTVSAFGFKDNPKDNTFALADHGIHFSKSPTECYQDRFGEVPISDTRNKRKFEPVSEKPADGQIVNEKNNDVDVGMQADNTWTCELQSSVAESSSATPKIDKDNLLEKTTANITNTNISGNAEFRDSRVLTHFQTQGSLIPSPTTMLEPFEGKKLANKDVHIAMEVDGTEEGVHAVKTCTFMLSSQNGSDTEPMDVDSNANEEKAARELIGAKNMVKQKETEEAEQIKREQRENEEKAAKELIDAENMVKQKEAKEAEQIKRKQREKVEKQHREQEQAKSTMEQCFQTSIVQLHRTFPIVVDTWINNHLNLQTINKMDFIYHDLLRRTTESHQSVVHKSLWNEFVSRVDHYCKQEQQYPLTLTSISGAVLEFCKAMKKQFDIHDYFTAGKLAELMESEYNKVKKDLGKEFLFEMVKLAIERLQTIYDKHNQIIIENEINFMGIATSELKSVYHAEMKRYVNDDNAAYSPTTLHSVHMKLVQKLTTAFQNAFKSSSDYVELVPRQQEILKTELDNGYGTHRESNARKLEKMQLEIRKIIEKLKTEYHTKTEEILKKCPAGLETKSLEKQNDDIQKELLTLLRMEIRSKVRESEPIVHHQEVLQSEMTKYWPVVVGENQKNIQRRKQQEQEYQREQNIIEGQKKLRLQEAKNAAESKRSTEYINSQPKAFESTRTCQDNLQVLSPLIFHLQTSGIVMAMNVNGSSQVLKNDSGEERTPACVLVTLENEVIYGTEALARAQHAQSNFETIEGGWSITDFFLNNDLSWSHVVNINGSDHKITAEFLLAFLLRKLKETVEFQMNGQCATTLLAIPFWLSSPQRIQIKDAATIAGFSEVYLVNESSAAAYNFVLGDLRSQSSAKVLVICENANIINAFVYFYTGWTKKLEMLEHVGYSQYDFENKKPGTFQKIVKGVLAYFLQTEEAPKDPDSMTRLVRKVCKSVIENASWKNGRYKIITNESLYICDNASKWSHPLSIVARDNGKTPNGFNPENAVVLGAVALANNPTEIGEFVRDKPAYNIERTRAVSGSVQVSSKTHSLGAKLKIQTTSLPTTVNETSFYQEIMQLSNVYHKIGDLSVDDLKRRHLEPWLEISNEAIVKLNDVLVHDNNQQKSHVDKNKLHWTTPNLSEVQRGTLASLLDSMITPKEDPMLVQTKSAVLQKCKEMIDKIDTGAWKFKTDISKNLIMGKIMEATEFAKHANTSVEVIQKQMESLQKFCDRYEKK